jgi:magnesium transporter
MSLLYAHEFARLLVREKPAVLSEASLAFFTENLVADAAGLEQEYSILRSRTSELMQMHRDNANTQLNNIMRTLTVISTVFLPLSFITSFYGMNFPNMPAVKWNGSFPIVLGVMVAISCGILYYARKHRWL